MQGWRKNHEDAQVFECSCGGPEPGGVFFVLDGHGGTAAATHSRSILQEVMVPLAQRSTLSSDAAKEELHRIFLQTDQRLRALVPAEERSGTTVVGALVTRTSASSYCIHLAHAGDSRAVVCADGRLCGTEDHKPARPDENKRISCAGGFVEAGPMGGPMRVDGTLAVSRAFGDFHFKPGDKAPEDCKVTPMPDVQTVYASSGDWILIACDGIFDVFTNEEVRDFIAPRLAESSPEKPVDGGEICQDLIKSSLDKGSKDNCTAMLIHLLPGSSDKPYERTLDPGGFTNATSIDIRQRYLDFFVAEGFMEEAELYKEQASVGRQASYASTASLSSKEEAASPAAARQIALTQALKAMKSSRQIQNAWRASRSKDDSGSDDAG
jgi:serine/threonine protein phosphatase PrpC